VQIVSWEDAVLSLPGKKDDNDFTSSQGIIVEHQNSIFVVPNTDLSLTKMK